MKKVIYLTLWIICINFIFISKLLAIETITVATSRYNSSAYLRLTNDIPCYQQPEYQPMSSNYRGAIDLHMLCQSFKAINFKVNFSFLPAFDYSGAIKLVKQGKADMIAETAWSNLISPDLLKSAPIYKKHEYELGIYTTLQNTTSLTIKTLTDFKRLNGASNKSWINDWQLLKSLKLKNTISADNSLEMFRLVKYSNVDFILWPFHFKTKDMSYTLSVADRTDQQYYKLYPVPNIKLSMPYSRHFIISSITPRADKIMANLNKGINILRNQGIIRQLYIDSGFLSDRAKDWQIIKLTNTTMANE